MKTTTMRLTALISLLIAPLISMAQFHNIPVWETDILFAGDLMQHGEQLRNARKADGTYSYSYYYKHIKKTVQDADIAVANLETPLGKSNFGGYPTFCAPDSFLYAALDAGFDVMLLANNHCLDRGKNGVMHTLDILDATKTLHCGLYRNQKEREERYPLLINHNNTRIVLLNYTYGTNRIETPAPIVVNIMDKKMMAKDIAKAKEIRADYIIACMHWGDEYLSIAPKKVKEMADWLIEQGVDHIIGNHPHVIQPIEIRDDKKTPDRHAVVYSTGNLVSNMTKRGTDGGIMVKMSLRKIHEYPQLHKLEYLLTWVAPRKNNGRRDFTILPAATTIIGNGKSKERLKLFLNDSRTLFRNHNKGNVTEFTADTVRIEQ